MPIKTALQIIDALYRGLSGYALDPISLSECNQNGQLEIFENESAGGLLIAQERSSTVA